MAADKFKIKCAACGKRNLVPVSETGFRVDADNRPVCWQCCRGIRWGSPSCSGCSDNVTCSGKLRDSMVEFIGKIGGI